MSTTRKPLIVVVVGRCQALQEQMGILYRRDGYRLVRTTELREHAIDQAHGLRVWLAHLPICILTNREEFANILGEEIECKLLSIEDVVVLRCDGRVTECRYDERGFLSNWPIGYFLPDEVNHMNHKQSDTPAKRRDALAVACGLPIKATDLRALQQVGCAQPLNGDIGPRLTDLGYLVAYRALAEAAGLSFELRALAQDLVQRYQALVFSEQAS